MYPSAWDCSLCSSVLDRSLCVCSRILDRLLCPSFLGHSPYPIRLSGSLCPGPLTVMSGLRMWAPWLLFLWQGMWLQVQTAPIMDSTLLTSIPLEFSIIPEPTLEAGATALQPNAAPEKHPTVTLPGPEPVQAQQPIFLPLEPEVPITPELTLEAEASLQQNAAPANHPEVTLPSSETVQAQQPTFTPFDLELTITPEPTLEAGATALQQNAAPTEHPEVTLQHPQLVQVQQPSFSEVTATVLPFDVEVTITQQPESSETVPPMTEQNTITNICELCSCNNGTLSCIGFGSNQRLHRVPVPEPSTYNGTFTVL
uniref:Leucine-rich repeat-containing protein 37 N-terminal domain-containing protein n=1 Tax=Pipistrellus kuhlii TaxID=59472 RepID=A0A7J7QSS6_PIPKU|nr:hypothetical protein mPipKuh1_008601 [Pipistrellus kuhlii]